MIMPTSRPPRSARPSGSTPVTTRPAWGSRSKPEPADQIAGVGSDNPEADLGEPRRRPRDRLAAGPGLRRTGSKPAATGIVGGTVERRLGEAGCGRRSGGEGAAGVGMTTRLESGHADVDPRRGDHRPRAAEAGRPKRSGWGSGRIEQGEDPAGPVDRPVRAARRPGRPRWRTGATRGSFAGWPPIPGDHVTGPQPAPRRPGWPPRRRSSTAAPGDR